MKRILYCLLFTAIISVSGIANAQSPYYYHTGDTIEGRSPIYFYQWWTEDWLADPYHKLTFYRDREPQSHQNVYANYWPHGELLQYCYTETPLNIIGIATSCEIVEYGFEFRPVPPDANLVFQEYLRLYDANEESFTLLKEVPYNTGTPKRYLKTTLRRNGYLDDRCCNEPKPNEDYYFPITEYYFDKPVTVYDSFYIGYTTENVFTNINYESDLYTWRGYYAWYELLGSCLFWNENLTDMSEECFTSCDYTPYHLRKFRHIVYDWDTLSPNYGDTIDREWHWRYNREFMLQFPIVAIDSSYIIPPYECPPVESPRVADQSNGQVILLWDTHPDHNSWQISYGPQGTEPDDGTIVNCPIQVGQINGLDTCTHYTAYVRAVCNHDSICYSQWSEPLDIYICDTTSGGGGDNSVTSALNMLTNIIPNPASTFATVYSSFQLTALEAYDLRGNKMLDTKASGASATINIADWPSGMYIVIVHTPAGNVAKKLVVK